jgi:F-type H+-transporting ATPase subunit gamma
MSRRRELVRRLGSLTDIADILGAMKSLALMETRTLLGFIACQERMVAGIEAALAELLAWHPALIHPSTRVAEDEGDSTPWRSVMPAPGMELRPPVTATVADERWPPAATPTAGEDLRPPAPFVPEAALWVMVGSEQGFCGDFNARLAARVRDPKARPLAGRWLVVGQRLATKLGDDPRILLQLPGATVADEVPAVLLRLTRELGRLLATADLAGESPGESAGETTGLATGEAAAGAAWKPAAGGLGVLYQDEATNDLRLRQLLPLGGPPSLPGAPDPFPPGLHGRTRMYPFPPVIQLPPGELLDGLTRHYLYAVLNQVLYSSLTAENRQRQAHMDQALQRLEEKAEHLRRACNAQRQEEITEEIEIILLSADAMN